MKSMGIKQLKELSSEPSTGGARVALALVLAGMTEP